ncbi:hypothetical protein RUM44_006162 [Polyplax serrata]|uniref:Uncharacterized protein n=1 Tax=Polyplax serrata TaxID=468196 RepID=A0ABR1AZ48_POLSC
MNSEENLKISGADVIDTFGKDRRKKGNGKIEMLSHIHAPYWEKGLRLSDVSLEDVRQHHPAREEERLLKQKGELSGIDSFDLRRGCRRETDDRNSILHFRRQVNTFLKSRFGFPKGRRDRPGRRG